MRKIVFIFLLMIAFRYMNGQDYMRPSNQYNPQVPQPPAAVIHQHKGFLLSMGLCPIFGTVNDAGNDPSIGRYSIDFDGTGTLFDIRIGGAIAENLFLHGTIVSTSLIGPSITGMGLNNFNIGNALSITEGMWGGGITYYLMPSNIFFSGSIGSGIYSFIDDQIKLNLSTARGFSFQVKAGKEWFVSKKWGLGAALGYLSTNVDNSSGNSTEKVTSGRFSIMFNATLN